jgi:uncharacterized phage-associated protein
VVPALFQEHRGRQRVEAGDLAGSSAGPAGLTDAERAHIDGVLAHYGQLPAAYLSRLTHHEQPWRDARKSGDRRGHESPPISVAAMRSFYSARTPEDLEADYQMSVARAVMDEHAESLAYLAL